MVRRRMTRYLFALVAILAVVMLTVRSVVPYIADHSDTALPIAGGLSFRIHHAGRTYLNADTCAGEDWCSGRPRCFTMEDLDMHGLTPLVPAGGVPTFLGTAHPLFVAPDSIVPHPTVSTPTYRLVVLDHGECYVIYGLSGGL